jgi:FkbM family methyltransferase
MPRQLDETWLLKRAANDNDRQTVRTILARRDRAVTEHIFYTEEGTLSLRLGPDLISMRECAAPASMEVYHEIFREDNHFLHGDFASPELEYVLDIGANEGYFALRVARANPGARILCVEPNPYAFEILSLNVGNNGLANVTPINAGASADGRDLEMEFVRQIHSIGGARLRDVERPWLPENVIEKRTVASIPITRLVEEHAFPRIDLLKIDVEGMEDEIVESIAPLAPMTARIVVERHSRALRDKVNGTLTGLGFDLVYEEDPGFEQYYGDMYFVRRRS